MQNKSPRPENRQAVGKTRPYATHRANTAGAKQLRRFYRAKHGVSERLEKVLEWWRTYNPDPIRRLRPTNAEKWGAVHSALIARAVAA